MDCFFCRDIETIRGVTPCCYQPMCEPCFNDEINTCTCGRRLLYYLRRLKKPSSEPVSDQLNTYIESKNAYLEKIKTYHWKIRTITLDAYTKELDTTTKSLTTLCNQYYHLVSNGVFVQPPVIPTFVPLGVCKKNIKSQWCVVSREFDTVLEQHPEIRWYWNWLFTNPNFPFQYVLDHPEKNHCIGICYLGIRIYPFNMCWTIPNSHGIGRGCPHMYPFNM